VANISGNILSQFQKIGVKLRENILSQFQKIGVKLRGNNLFEFAKDWDKSCSPLFAAFFSNIPHYFTDNSAVK